MFHFPETDFKIGALFFASITALVVIWGMADLCCAQTVHTGKINAAKLNVRSNPDNQANVVVVLNKGDLVNVLAIKGGIGGWLTVEYQGRKGYIRNRPRYILLNQKSSSLKQKRKSASSNRTSSPPVKTLAKDLKKKDVSQNYSGKKQTQKQTLARKIREENKKVKKIAQKEVQILDGLNKIDRALNQARLNARALRQDAIAIAQKTGEIQERIADLNRSMKATQGYAENRLNALFHMHMMGRIEMAGPPSSLFNFVVTQNALKKVVAADFSMLNKQARNIMELNALEQDLSRQLKLKSDMQYQLGYQIAIRKKEAFKKEEILKDIRRRKRLSIAAKKSLEASAWALDQTLSAIAPQEKPFAVKKRSFAGQKGRLQPPVNGEIMSRFGTRSKGDYNAFTFQSGIDIKAVQGAPVKNVFSGKVMFAQWMKSYGNLMIINHGNNYYTLYAHAEELYKKKGDTVDTGETIGTVGDTGSIKGPCLHFEVRHHGKPVDPLKWLKKGAS